ncbi:phenylalanine--tRNA ligase subunit beta [Rhizobacter sp. Root1221]|uniref:phenylalanine--tRNA ligase subunit beta n=1 Tax=Rhizobacter sp. Root1221 TaxID=1736433 RepID=UPI0006FEE289|nr:phenylalanine--tRNA ligase subunit beta [Rhizobacter sp. Root1221]KQW03078.1 phenylalanine--tRNA ligase subunit beta [Rhizobacter sp. Root1221]
MQFPESWLREFCNPPLSTQALADTLTMAGMEVEELRPVAPPFSNVVVGEVLEVVRHPNADRLNVCQVKVGPETVLSIVCGAANVAPGIKVPCAMVGAKLPPAEEGGAPFEIKLGKLRGVESQGMLCSAKELKLSDESSGLLILGDDALVGNSIRDHLRLDDTLFTLKLTPNLGHCLSVFGIARELSALTGAPLTVPPTPRVPVSQDDRLPVQVRAGDLCGRFSGRIVKNVDTKAKTPAWMVDRLARCGQRSVTALVDISNYVMFEAGQPSHIFDLDKIHGGLEVRWGRADESLKLLNGNTVGLDPKTGVIADDRAVESLAGIMGGDATSVSDDTRNVYVEAAFWWPASVAGRARKYNFSTDASHRYERGVDPARTVASVERVTQLILDICGGEACPVDDQAVNVPSAKPVVLRVARASKVIGMPVTQAQCADVFARLGLQAIETAPGVLAVTPPTWRFDIQIEEDLIEEVVRVIGFDKLPDTPPNAPVTARALTETRRSVHAVRHALAGRDYFETINFSFVEERTEHELAGNLDPIRVLNPIASPLSVMRSTLFGSLVSVLRFNLARKASRVRLFEVGRVFRRDASVAATLTTVAGISQPLRVAGLAYGPADTTQWTHKDRTVDFFDVKGDIEALLAPRVATFEAAEHPALHPGRSARIVIDGQEAGFVGELHPRWRQGYELPGAPVLFELDANLLTQREVPQAVPVQRQQSAWRDIAVIAGEQVTHSALIDTILSADRALVKSARLFDIYKPTAASADMAAGERSLAVRLELLDDTTTLTDERIDVVVAAVLDALKTRLGARLRG